MNQYLNISAYKFVPLEKTATLRVDLLKKAEDLGIKGTILLSHEGININLAGEPEAIKHYEKFLNADERFADIRFKHSYSEFVPFSKMVIKLKEEIIRMGVDDVNPPSEPESAISPKELKKWYEEGKDFTVLDTRNTYETKIGSFKDAKLLPLDNFRQFPAMMQAMSKEDKAKPMVMFCTGGVRCEKAMPFLKEEGFKEIYQLHGGILKYFEECGGDYWDGECFVFDDRIAVDPDLKATGAQLCHECQEPVTLAEQAKSNYPNTGKCLKCLDSGHV